MTAIGCTSALEWKRSLSLVLFLLDRALQTERPKRNCQVSYAQDNDEDRFPSGLIQKVLILLSQVFRGLFYKALPENVPAGVSAKKCSNSEHSFHLRAKLSSAPPWLSIFPGKVKVKSADLRCRSKPSLRRIRALGDTLIYKLSGALGFWAVLPGAVMCQPVVFLIYPLVPAIKGIHIQPHFENIRTTASISSREQTFFSNDKLSFLSSVSIEH